MTLKLENAHGLMRKISNNLLNFGTTKVTAFTFPVEGIVLDRDQLNGFMGAYTFNSWYEQRTDGVWVPMPWWNRLKNREMKITDEFVSETAVIVVSGDQVLTFEAEEPENEDDDTRPAARITRVVLTAQDGGSTLLAFRMHVRPGVGKTNLLLQEHQFRHVAITLSDTEVAEGETEEQGDLPLEQPRQEPRDTTPIWWQNEAGENWSGPRCEMPAGCVEIDPPVGSNSEAAQEALASDAPEADSAVVADDTAAVPNTDTTGAALESLEDLQAFEAGTAAQVAAFNATPGTVIDGRSERVKHQDRQRGRGKRQGAH